MYLIVGLGNPGSKYNKTRHNVGFETLDILIDRNNISGPTEKYKAMLGKGIVGGEKAVLAKPLTYMNLSGDSVWKIVDFYKVDPAKELIVISDDIALDVGKIRIRKQGSAGGHNGLKSIIASLGKSEFIRVRVGVGGKPEGWDLANHVLGQFTGDEKKLIEEAKERAADAVECILREGVDAAMNKFN